MPVFDKNTLDKLIEKFGPTIDIQARPDVLAEILREVFHAREFRRPKAIDEGEAGYDKTYERGYDKTDNAYDRTYNQYDKTVDNDLVKQIANKIASEIDLHLLDKLRGEKGHDTDK